MPISIKNRIKVLDHFYLDELIDIQTYKAFKEESIRFLRPTALILLEKIRVHFNDPITINNWIKQGIYNWSGLRTPDYKNFNITSLHAWGGAFDLKFKTFTPEEIRKELMNKRDTLFEELTGIELNTSTWVHIDTRFRKDGKLFPFNPKK